MYIQVIQFSGRFFCTIIIEVILPDSISVSLLCGLSNGKKAYYKGVDGGSACAQHIRVGDGPGIRLPLWLNGKESAYGCRRCRFHSWVRKIPWRRKWQLTPVFLPGILHGHWSLVDCSPCGPERAGHKRLNNNKTANRWKQCIYTAYQSW